MLSIGTQKRIISKGISGTYKLYNIGFKKCTQIFGKQAKFLVNKFDAELPIGTQKSISQFFNYLFISGLHIYKVLTRKTRFLKRSKNASALFSSTCIFKYLKIMKIIHIRERPARRLTNTDYQ